MATPNLARESKSPLAKLYGKHESRYLELLNRFPLRPIRTEDELDRATEALHELIDQVPEEKLNKAEADYLDVLSELVEAYESMHHPIEDVPAHQVLTYLMELKGVTQGQVASGARIPPSTISELLSGKREMNKNQIVKLAGYFKIDPGVFLPDIKLPRAVR